MFRPITVPLVVSSHPTSLRYLEQRPISAYKENILDRATRLINRHGTAIGLETVYLVMRILFIVFAGH
jgi:hypothetical protein